MRATTIERALWSIAAGAIVAATLAVRSTAATPSIIAPSALRAPVEPRRLDPDSIAKAAAYVATSDPFRLSRQPASVAYSPALEGLAPSVVARPPRPNLVLRGIVGGPPWSAILDGIPGRDGSAVLRKGDSVGTIVVRAVGRDTVIIKGADTTWRLTVKRAW